MSVYELVEPKCGLSELVLPDAVTDALKEILEDHYFQDALSEAGLTVRKRILLHGPPGCGKTSIAHAVAHEASICLAVRCRWGCDSFVPVDGLENIPKLTESLQSLIA